MSTEFGRGRQRAGLVLAVTLAVYGCNPPPTAAPAAAAAADQGWSITAWGSHYEVFPEIGPLIAGATATAHVHVTRLDDFTPAAGETVEVVLEGMAGEEVYAADGQPARSGIFTVEIEAPPPGEYELSFRIRAAADAASFEAIRGGRVRVGTAEQPGGIFVAPAPRGALEAAEPVTFLKEEQWRSEFATVWVRSGRWARALVGLARVRPPAGGETLVTSPVAGVIQPARGAPSWPFVGLSVERGGPLFQVIPHVAAEHSLATLEAETAALDAEWETARGRLSRLDELLSLEAASRREVEEARTRVQTLEARRDAAAHDLEAARSSRVGTASTGLPLSAPFAGRIARLDVSPGATVAAGESLARLVRTDRAWLEISLPGPSARRIAAEGVRSIVLMDPEHGATSLEAVRLISVAPELSPETGNATVLIEAPPTAGLLLGTILEARVLLLEERDGIVIPASALVDDGGVSVVYLQLSGERFVRQEIRVLERQGDRLLVERLVPGQRLVSRGGDAIRRSSLMAGGGAHGHVH